MQEFKGNITDLSNLEKFRNIKKAIHRFLVLKLDD